eukprot:5856345-Prymnesium_polylepis.1
MRMWSCGRYAMTIPTQTSLHDYLNVYAQKVTDEAIPYFTAVYNNPQYASVQATVGFLLAGLQGLAS